MQLKYLEPEELGLQMTNTDEHRVKHDRPEAPT